MPAAAVLLLCVHVALGHGCGVPHHSHQPSVTIQGGKITGMKQGIHGGQEAVRHSWPWMASLGDCGAALLNKQWLVTAAHCVADDTGAPLPGGARKVALGTHKPWPASEHEWLQTSRTIVHPGYKGTCKGTGYDIALLKLPHAIKFTDKVQPICLPEKSDDFKTDGENIVISGWGYLNAAGRPANELQQAVFATSLTDCQRTWLGSGHSNKDTEFCAWGGQGTAVTACPGDSGSPQVAYRGGKYVLAGVASCAVCASAYSPGIFTHVPSYVDWITGHIADVDAGQGRDADAPPTCVDKRAFCSKDPYIRMCNMGIDIMLLCPKTCGTCSP